MSCEFLFDPIAAATVVAGTEDQVLQPLLRSAEVASCGDFIVPVSLVEHSHDCCSCLLEIRSKEYRLLCAFVENHR